MRHGVVEHLVRIRVRVRVRVRVIRSHGVVEHLVRVRIRVRVRVRVGVRVKVVGSCGVVEHVELGLGVGGRAPQQGRSDRRHAAHQHLVVVVKVDGEGALRRGELEHVVEVDDEQHHQPRRQHGGQRLPVDVRVRDRVRVRVGVGVGVRVRVRVRVRVGVRVACQWMLSRS